MFSATPVPALPWIVTGGGLAHSGRRDGRPWPSMVDLDRPASRAAGQRVLAARVEPRGAAARWRGGPLLSARLTARPAVEAGEVELAVGEGGFTSCGMAPAVNPTPAPAPESRRSPTPGRRAMGAEFRGHRHPVVGLGDHRRLAGDGRAPPRIRPGADGEGVEAVESFERGPIAGR